MRILHFMNSLCAGGAESFVVSLAIAQSRLRHEVHLLTYAGALDDRGEALAAQLSRAHIAHHSANARRAGQKLRVPAQVARHISVVRPAVVHAHLDVSELFACLAMGLLPRPRPVLVRTIHGPARRFGQLTQTVLAGFFDRTVDCAAALAGERRGRSRAAELSIDNGIALDTLETTGAAVGLRARLGVAPDELLILNIGSFTLHRGLTVKGQDVLIDALTRVRPAVTVVFAGDGPARAAMELRARASGVLHRCRFVGRVNRTADYIAASDCVVMPSRLEGLSLAAIEAACLGRPLIVTDLRAFGPFAGPATLVSRCGSVASLCDAIEQAAASRAELAGAARERMTHYRARFDITHCARRYLEAYASAGAVDATATTPRAA